MKRARISQMILYVTLVVSTLVFAAGCDVTGACAGWSDTLGSSYCYDDWYEDECEEWDAIGVNDADWYFHAGQTCSERGSY